MACWCDEEDEHCVCWRVLGSGMERVYEGEKMMSAAGASFLLVPPLRSGPNTTKA